MRNALSNVFARLRRDEKGATLVEYGIALLVAVTVGTVAMGSLGDKVLDKVNEGCVALDGTVC